MIASATVQFYDVVTFFHITAVVIGFGPTYAYAVFATVAAKHGPRPSLAVEEAILKWNAMAVNVGMVVILLTGFYLADDRWEFSEFFISWGFVAILALFGIAHVYFLPRERKLVARLREEVRTSGDDPDWDRPTDIQAIERGIERMGIFAGLLVLLTIYVMTAKPFL